jgi:hypothetical protein
MNLIKKKSQQTEEVKEIRTVIEIKEHRIEIPKDGEMIVFQVPKETPIDAIREMERCLIETQNRNRQFIIFGGEIKIIKKPAETEITIGGKDGRTSNQSAGHKGP